MSSKETNNLGTALRDHRKGESIEALALRLGVSRNTLGAYERGDSAPDVRFLQRYAEATGAPLNVLMACMLSDLPGEDARSIGRLLKNTAGVFIHDQVIDRSRRSSEYVKIPQYDVKASAGQGAIVEEESIIGFLEVSKNWVRNILNAEPGKLGIINIDGDSMMPTLAHGEQVLCDLRKNRLDNDAVYAIQYDGHLRVKRIQLRLDGSVVVKSDNPRFDPEYLTAAQAEQLHVIGRIIPWKFGKFEI